ncbi:MAG: THUMP-like domain-containing protein [Bythopirellula sp.]
MADLSDYEWLTSADAALVLTEVALTDDPVHRQLQRLRKTLSADRARLVVQQIELRKRATTKFGDLAAQLFFTDVALQQATDLWTARYKAGRVSSQQPVVDYCCGIGGDLLAFAERAPTTGWDRAPEIAHLANANLRVTQRAAQGNVLVGDAQAETPSAGEVWHLDPDRRSEGQRSTQLQFHSPGPELVQRWLQQSPNGVLKLAPATVVPTAWAEQGELEWVTQNRECRQQIAWFGELATTCGRHRATQLSANLAGDCASFVGTPNLRPALAGQVCRYVFDTNPSIRAAGLTGALAIELDLQSINDGVSYLTAERPIDHPLLTCFEVIDQLPLRVATLSPQLRSLHIGRLEIKKRGVDTDPEQLRKQLKLRGDQWATLLLTRLGASEVALLARRLRD